MDKHVSTSFFLLTLFAFVSCGGPSESTENLRSQVPEARGGAPAVWIPGQQEMVLFGGMSPITNDTWQYSSTENRWEEIIDNDIPAPRCHHTFVSNQEGSNILLFGGFSNNGRFNDTWRYDAQSDNWTKLDVTGTLPDRRCLQASAYIESTDQMFVYGGISGGGVSTGDFFQDTWLFDSANQAWEMIDTPVNPGKLSGAIAFYSSEQNAAFLWGGKQVDTYPNDLWKFDMTNKSWSVVETNGANPVGLEDPTYFWNDQNQVLYVTHGFNETLPEMHPDDAFELNLRTSTWTALTGQVVPDRRWRASVIFDSASQTGYMFGGWIGFNQENLDDLWKYNFQTREWEEVTSVR